MEFAEAQALFAEKAKSLNKEAFQNSESVEVRKDRASLRLRSVSAGVVLEINHGPEDQPDAFWLDLYSDSIKLVDPSFRECLDHGFELIFPQ